MRTQEYAYCVECGPLTRVGRRTLDSSAEKHTKDTGHLTVSGVRPMSTGEKVAGAAPEHTPGGRTSAQAGGM